MGKLIALFQKAQKNLFKQAYVIMPQHRQECDVIEKKAQSERRKLRNQSAEIASHNSPFDSLTALICKNPRRVGNHVKLHLPMLPYEQKESLLIILFCF